MMQFHPIFAVVAFIGVPTLLPAEDLAIGVPAPKLSSMIFVKGEPVNDLAKGTRYVVEFRGTACVHASAGRPAARVPPTSHSGQRACRLSFSIVHFPALEFTRSQKGVPVEVVGI